MKDFFINFWAKCVEIYCAYSDLIHSVFPKDLGDLVEYVLDIVIVIAIIKIVASIAFSTKNNG